MGQRVGGEQHWGVGQAGGNRARVEIRIMWQWQCRAWAQGRATICSLHAPMMAPVQQAGNKGSRSHVCPRPQSCADTTLQSIPGSPWRLTKTCMGSVHGWTDRMGPWAGRELYPGAGQGARAEDQDCGVVTAWGQGRGRVTIDSLQDPAWGITEGGTVPASVPSPLCNVGCWCCSWCSCWRCSPDSDWFPGTEYHAEAVSVCCAAGESDSQDSLWPESWLTIENGQRLCSYLSLNEVTAQREHHPMPYMAHITFCRLNFKYNKLIY